MKVSVILPCYNAGPALGRCLTALRRQDLGGAHPLEVIVVDDGSTDGTASLVEAFDPGLRPVYVHLPRTATSGRSAARNTGIRHATGDLIVMIDPDHVFPGDFLARHVRHHEQRTDLVVAGPRHRMGGTVADFTRDWSFEALPPPRDVRVMVLARLGLPFGDLATCWYYAFSCNLSVRREHLLAVGGFDEGFTGWGLEDSELGYRLRRHGLAFAFEPAAVLYTWERGGMTARRYADWRRNLAHFTAVHPGADVAQIRLLDDTFNPDVTVEDGIGRYAQFEHAVRALTAPARRPRPGTASG
ncbi:glycosyltransferase family 2 protein [Dactylosporangium cerinum]|uniref:Glycosyltransferase family 2 protein n=1 Tax=Dactylosporangium cerinum TaxID=1434730 RepID=A0ABV9WKN4_9ACTN